MVSDIKGLLSIVLPNHEWSTPVPQVTKPFLAFNSEIT